VELFSIVCTTCQAKLRVRDQSAIGKILACPKCGSMVMVDAPAQVSGVTTSADTPTSKAKTPATPVDTPPPSASPADAMPPDAMPADALPASASPAHVSPVNASPSHHSPTAESAEADRPEAPASKPRTVPPKRKPRFRGEYPENDDSSPSDKVKNKPPTRTVAAGAGAPTEDQAPVMSGDQWASPATRQLKQIVVLLGAAVFGIALAIGLIAMIASWRSAADPDDAERASKSVAVDTESESADSKAEVGDSDDSESSVADRPPTVVPPESPDSQSTDQEVASDNGTPPTTVEPALDSSSGSPLPNVPEPNDTDNPPGLVSPKDPDSEVAADSADTAMDSNDVASPPDVATSPPAPPSNGDSEFVKSQLSFVFNAVQETELSLADLTVFVTDLTTIPVTLDLDSLAASGITASSPLSFEHRGITIEQLLTTALEAEGMAFVVDKRQIIVTSAEAAQGTMTEQTYNVADLVETDEELQTLSKQLTEFIQPSSWNLYGGQGSITAEEHSLVVEQFPAVHFQLTVMLDRLRLARGLLQRSELPIEWLAVEPVYQRLSTALSAPITVNYSTPTPVSRILAYLNGETDLTILVNWHAVTSAEWAPNSPSQLVATNESLTELLTKWLSPSNLTFRVVDEQTIQITSREALDARPDVEFYRLDASPDLAAFEGELRQKLKRDTAIPVAFDEPSSSLIVSLPQSQQPRVADTLSSVKTGQ
jgi:DNA-directed RNA polymerase subunit RPC12/RpoP